MGGRWFADEHGEFDLSVRDGDGNELARIVLDRLDPGQELHAELRRGRDR